jgi:lysophospholipase L1-like esterase
MKAFFVKFIIITLLLHVAVNTIAQQATFSKYYYQRVSLFEKLPDARHEIIFLGNSITDGCEWIELFNNKHIKNRGISGDVTAGVLNRLSEVTSSKPKKVFLLIGINDLSNNVTSDSVVANIRSIVRTIHLQSPKTKVYVQSILPVNESFKVFLKISGKTAQILQANSMLKEVSSLDHYTFIDLFSRFKNSDDNQMNPRYTNDGLHLMGDGYLLWAEILKPYL